MVTWREFAVAAPGLAPVGRSLREQFGVALAFFAAVPPMRSLHETWRSP